MLIILATVSINAVFSEGGIIKKAELAKQIQANATAKEQEEMDELANAIPTIDGNSTNPGTPDNRPLVTTLTSAQSKTIEAKDSKGNKVMVPGGFKVTNDSTTVQQGIIIEDCTDTTTQGSQFVWIPVGNVTKDDGTVVNIEFGRYSDFTVETATPAQTAADYASTVTIGDYYQELSTFRESNGLADTTGTNSTAANLQQFISKTLSNGGYYLARYEASYGSGSEFGVGTDSKYYKPLSKVSTAKSKDSMNYTSGTLWNYIKQGESSKASRNMYYGNTNVTSDLVNSYAWDTAIMYIEKCSNNSTYANKTSTNTSLSNTGTIGDEACHINDMASNLREWTTEYSTSTGSFNANPCVYRGGSYDNTNLYTSFRRGNFATDSNNHARFPSSTLCNVILSARGNRMKRSRRKVRQG